MQNRFARVIMAKLESAQQTALRVAPIARRAQLSALYARVGCSRRLAYGATAGGSLSAMREMSASIAGRYP